MLMAEEITEAPIEKEMQSSYIDYAMSVIVGRALPDARDGLKPAQRRILWAMYGLGNTHDQPTKKSARIVGECFAKDTLVLTDKGLIPIQNIEKGAKVYTQDGLQKVSELYIMPKRKLIKVAIGAGMENIVTSSQQFKVLTKDWKIVWRAAKDLKCGDYVLTKSLYPEITEYVDLGQRRLNENIAYLLGQWLSDGFILMDNDRGKYHRIGFCSASVEIIKTIELCLQHEFGYNPKIEERKTEYESKDGSKCTGMIYHIRVHNRDVCDFFIKTFDLLGRKAQTKRIPQQIFISPKSVISALLSGMFDGDGHIHKERNIIEYATISNEIANQLLILLHHLDIHGKKYKSRKEGETKILGRKVHVNDAFSLEFAGINAQRLASILNLREEKKRERSQDLLTRNLKKSDYDVLPWAGEKLFTELSSKHIGSGWYKDSEGRKFRAGIKYRTGAKIRYSSDLHSTQLRISQVLEWGIQDKLARIKSQYAPFMASIVRDKINFSPVISVEEFGEDITYDIGVDSQHEFVANGMLSHNCIGKYHPHGDIAAYETLVRMAQDFSMNHTLVQGQGNMGSVDGDSPAAQRYTEVKLNKLAEEMLADLEKKAVPFVPNFDNTEEEPLVLPAKVPNLLVNGAAGIAVGFATNIMQHNLREICDAVIAYIEKQDITPQELLQYIQGPDFATGGIVFRNSALIASYLTGRGSCILRGKAVIEEEKNRNVILITEIPYTVNKATMVQKIAELVKEKKVQGISDLRDESGKEGIRVVIELKKDANANAVLNTLYKHTQLQISFPVMNIAVIGNNLMTMNIRNFIKTFVDHRLDVIKKRTKFDLDVASDRLHIVDGLLIAIVNINEVIATIKKSSDAKEARSHLMSKYSLSEKQATAILDMKLSKLTSLESTSLETEKKDLVQKITNFKEILENESKVYQIIKEETKELKEKYGRDRRTQVEQSEFEEIENEDLIPDEETTVILTSKNYMKRLPTNAYRAQGRGGKGIIAIELTEGDFVKQIVSCMTKDYLLVLTNKGRAYWMKAWQVPEAGRYGHGKAAVNLVRLAEGESIEKVIDTRAFEKSFMTFVTRKGKIKRVNAERFSRPRANGIIAMPLEDGDTLADTCISDGKSQIFIATKRGKALRFDENDVRPMGRVARGVRGIRIGNNDQVVNVLVARETDYIATITENGFGKVTELKEYRLQRRGGKGVINLKVKEKTGYVVKSLKVMPEESVLLINSKGLSIQFPVSEIRQTGRSASGVRLMRVEPGVRVVDAQTV